MSGRGPSLVSAVTAAWIAFAPGCVAPPRSDLGAAVSAPPAVDPAALGRVEALASEARAWLVARYGPPRGPLATVRLVPDSQWLADERAREGLEAAPSLAWRPGDRDLSIATDDPPCVLLAPCFGSYARADALARWIFYVEWTRDLPPWLREGLAETVGAAFSAERHPTEYDRTLDGLLPPWVARTRTAFPDVARLASLDAREAARAFADAARVVAAATDGGRPEDVRALIARPPVSRAEVATFAAAARARAATFPSVERVTRALSERPRASSTTSLVEAATPPPGAEEPLPAAALDPAPLEEALVRLARANLADQRRLGIYGLGRAKSGRARALVERALEDPSPAVRTTAIIARARAHDARVARRLIELAKDAPVDEVPGRLVPVLALFDRLTGYEDVAPSEPAELSLQVPAGGFACPGATGVRPSYREIRRREEWLRAAEERR